MRAYRSTASGTLPSGESFRGPGELKAILKARPREFTRCLTEKMLTYALGRGLEESDRCAVDRIVKDLEAERVPRLGAGAGDRDERAVPQATVLTGGRDRRRRRDEAVGRAVAADRLARDGHGRSPCPGWRRWRPIAALAEGAAGRSATSPGGSRSCTCPTASTCADWTPAEDGIRLPPAADPPAARAVPGRPARPHRPGAAQRAPIGDDGGDHARSLACFLTGTHPLKTDGANIRAGISIDQVAAGQIGQAHAAAVARAGDRAVGPGGQLRLGLQLRLLVEHLLAVGDHADGQGDQPQAGLRPPLRRAAARRLAGRSRQARALRAEHPRLRPRRRPATPRPARARATAARSTSTSTSVREIERRIEQARASQPSSGPTRTSTRPSGIPNDLREHIRLMFDLMALAFQTDVTRICTFMFANEASNRAYPFLNVPDGHHDLSHHGNDPRKHEKIRVINRFHVEQFAYLLGKLKSIREGDGTLLDHVDDRLRQRHQRRRPPQPRRPADPPGRQGRRHDQDRPPHPVRLRSRSTTSISSMLDRMGVRSTAMGTARGGWRCSSPEWLRSQDDTERCANDDVR